MNRSVRGVAVAALAVAVSLAVVGVPLWLIRPFAPQTPATVEWSWRLETLAPRLTVGLGLLALAVIVSTLRQPARFRRTAALRAVVCVVILAGHGGAIWFARQNHFEWMFRPFPDPRFVAASAAADVEPDEPVIGVARGAEAVAFPITRIGYHHLVNTALGDVPIVGTY
jgi:peptidoglycan/LPS O-acetylase OafA/YrhL